MKKLSIEEKAKRFDEIIDKFDVILNLNIVKESGTIFADDVRKIIPELIENEDEEIRKHIIQVFRDHFNGEDCDKCIAWLEKQGEQKPIDKIQLGKKYKCIASPRYSTFRKGEIYKPEDKFLCSLMNLCSNCFEPIEDSGQKQPKFEIGDLITNGKLVGKIDEINERGYHAYFENYYADIPDIENWHKWTIQDAKDGDVLASKDGNPILIFRGIGNTNWDDVIDYHCYYDRYREEFIVQKDVEYWGNIYNHQLKPATKEQRNLLFQKMHEAGYEWDANKKELKRIEQKPAEWGGNEGEQKQGINLLITQSEYINNMEGNGCYLKNTTQISAWNERDIHILTNIYSFVAENTIDINRCGCANECLAWLKSLKNRITWKPSDKQMKALDIAIRCGIQLGSWEEEALKSLKEQLFKLKELREE